MRSYQDAKEMAVTLRNSLNKDGANISHSQSLEIVANMFGCDNWNILSSAIKKSIGSHVEASEGGSESNLCCSFCGRQENKTRTLIVGPKAKICDQCIEFCSETALKSQAAELATTAARDGDFSNLIVFLKKRPSDQLANWIESWKQISSLKPEVRSNRCADVKTARQADKILSDEHRRLSNLPIAVQVAEQILLDRS